MTISSSLNASVAGLTANASRLAAISDNIANSATNGYKRATTDFHSMVTNSGTSKYSAGGVRVSNARQIDLNGSLSAATNATDLAIRGRGFLPVTSETALVSAAGNFPTMLTTTGSFRTDADGILRTASGQVLLGWPALSDGSIPGYPRDTADGLAPVQISATQFIAEPTTAMTLGVNLPATETDFAASGTPLDLTVEYFDNVGMSQSLMATYTPTIPASGSSNEWTMTLRDGAQADAVVGVYTVTFDATRGAGGTIASVTQPLVDVNGNPDPAGSTIGAPYDPLTGQFQINVGSGPIDIDIGLIGSGTGMTQLSDSFAPTQIVKDGFPVGNMTSVEVDGNGMLSANFDTGVSRVLYQIPLIDVPNPNGLMAHDNQTYTTSFTSGPMFLWDAGDGPTGEIVGFALEESTTEVAAELTALIQTQRAYSSNAKVIQTVDEMLQETTNIKR